MASLSQSQNSLPSTDPSSGPLSNSQLQPEPQTQPLLDAPGEADIDTTLEVDVSMGNTTDNTQSQSFQQNMSSGTTAVDSSALGVSQLDGTAEEEGVRVPTKKDATLKEFLGKMDDYAPIIPDAVTTHYLLTSGLPAPPTTPLPLARLLALATQKFIADIAADAYQYSRIRNSTSSSSNNPLASTSMLPTAIGGAAGGAGGGAGDKDKKGTAGTAHLGVQRAGFGGGGAGGGNKTVLTMEDLGMAVGEYGVSVKRGEFYR